MSPYRTSSRAEERRRIAFGESSRWLLVLALALVALTVGIVVSWLFTGGGVHGSVLLPAIVGLAILARSRGGTIEYHPETDELEVRVRTLLVLAAAIRVPAASVAALTVHASSDKHRGRELRLVFRDGRVQTLIEASSEATLEPARRAVSDFLLAEGIPRPLSAAPVRVASDVVVLEGPAAAEAWARFEEEADATADREEREAAEGEAAEGEAAEESEVEEPRVAARRAHRR